MIGSVAKDTLAPLVLRLGLAVIFIYHAQGKVSQENGWGTTWMNKMPGMSNPPPGPAQAAAAWGELVAGFALSVGFLARVAALGLIPIMGGAIYMVHAKNGFEVRNGGYEYNLALILMCLAVVFLGAGSLSVDRYILLRRNRAAGSSSSSPAR